MSYVNESGTHSVTPIYVGCGITFGDAYKDMEIEVELNGDNMPHLLLTVEDDVSRKMYINQEMVDAHRQKHESAVRNT